MQAALYLSAFHPLSHANLCQLFTTANATRYPARRIFSAPSMGID
jgi:hypothetical protein